MHHEHSDSLKIYVYGNLAFAKRSLLLRKFKNFLKMENRNTGKENGLFNIFIE